VPPLEKVKTKGAPKSMKSSKCEPSMWECVDEMNMMVGSSRTSSVAHKVGHHKKKTKIDHYMVEFPDEMQQYILNIVDAIDNYCVESHLNHI